MSGTDPEEKRQKIISWLSPLNFQQKQQTVLSDRHAGTGQWFLKSEEFKRWLEGKSKYLWCHGEPGCGKTVLASIVVDDLRQHFSQEQETTVAVVYCEYKRQDMQTPSNLMASIWSQIIAVGPLATKVEDLFDQHARDGTTTTFDQIYNILELAVETLASIFLVIDALDELTERNYASVFLGALDKLATSHPKVHILVTSRSEFCTLPGATSIRATAKRSDIECYVKDAIEGGICSSQVLSNQVKSDEALKERMVQAIGKKADGLFLLASRWIESLQGKTNLESVRNSIETLPPSIHKQYDETWKRIDGQNTEHRSLALRILGWLSHAMRPLMVKELQHALAVRPGDKDINPERLDAEDLFVRICHTLVRIEQETQNLYLAHSTVQQYLDTRRSQLFLDVQAQILRTCLTYLSFDEFHQGSCTFRTLRAYEVNGVANGKRIAKKRFLPRRLSKYPFLDYAACNWGRHAMGNVGLAHQDDILAFLQTPTLLESAAQIHKCDMLHSWTETKESKDRIQKNLPLFVASSFGLDHIVAALLTGLEEFAVDEKFGNHKNTVLHYAVAMGYSGLTRILLNAGADPQAEAVVQHTALWKAIACGRDEIVEILLAYSHGTLVEPAVIYCATFRENKAAIRSILEHSKDQAERQGRVNRILFHAAGLGRVTMLETALQWGAKLNAKDDKGQTAIFLAVKYGRPGAFEWLLRKHASMTERDRSGLNLLQLAVSTHEVIWEHIRFLEHFGSEYAGIPETSDHNGGCSLEKPMVPDHFFMSQLRIWLEGHRNGTTTAALKDKGLKQLLYQDDDHVKILKLILARGMDINERDPEGRSILHLAAHSTLDRIRAVLDAGGNVLTVDALDSDERTPLHYAAAKGKADSMKLLLQRGARIDAIDKYQASTLHFGVNSVACTKLTLNRSAAINAQDRELKTALHYAASVEEPNGKVIDLLIAGGVRPGTVDMDRKAYHECTYSNFEPQELMHWIAGMFYGYHEAMGYGALYGALDNSGYHADIIDSRFVRLGKGWRMEADQDKTWTEVSDSDEEDFDVSRT
ncbi:MAG: hypothetical protein Q9170_002420 [Blastenia crenularia]